MDHQGKISSLFDSVSDLCEAVAAFRATLVREQEGEEPGSSPHRRLGLMIGRLDRVLSLLEDEITRNILEVKDWVLLLEQMRSGKFVG